MKTTSISAKEPLEANISTVPFNVNNQNSKLSNTITDKYSEIELQPDANHSPAKSSQEIISKEKKLYSDEIMM